MCPGRLRHVTKDSEPALASGTETPLKPSETRLCVSKLAANKVDTTGLTPEAVTAFVMASEEVTGGTSTAPEDLDDVGRSPYLKRKCGCVALTPPSRAS
jgi:hypothetical protein